MAIKRKTKKKTTSSKRTASPKAAPAKKRAQKRKPSKKSAKKPGPRSKAVAKKKPSRRTAQKAIRRKADVGSQRPEKEPRASAFLRDLPGRRSAGQSGDLQGLSKVESADSESVDELIEEGNAFEAGVVTGVEDAGAHAEKEVRTHEVLEDDVPGEYLDKE
jgi:hypothetical protein